MDGALDLAKVPIENMQLRIIAVIIIFSAFLFGCSCHISDVFDNNGELSKIDFPPVNPATLTNEDGTGILHIGMSRNDFINQLDKWNLNYKIDDTPEISTFSWVIVNYGGYTYTFDKDHFLTDVQIEKTAKGLESGDNVEKMEKLYGIDYQSTFYETENGGKVYGYTYRYSDSVYFSITAYGEGKDALTGEFRIGKSTAGELE